MRELRCSYSSKYIHYSNVLSCVWKELVQCQDFFSRDYHARKSVSHFWAHYRVAGQHDGTGRNCFSQPDPEETWFDSRVARSCPLPSSLHACRNVQKTLQDEHSGAWCVCDRKKQAHIGVWSVELSISSVRLMFKLANDVTITVELLCLWGAWCSSPK